MGEVSMTSSAHSPTVLERYNISRENSSIGFEIGNNVVLHMSSHDEDDNGRDRDSSNVHTKVIMDHRGDIRNLNGKVLTTYNNIIGFRSVNENFGESVNIINLQTKQRLRFKEFGDRTAIDIAFAHHYNFFAILDAESSLFIYKTSENCEAQKYISILNWPSRSTPDSSELPRLSWCPYVPNEDDDEEDTCHMLAIFSGRHMHILNIGTLKESGKGEDFDFEEAKNVEGAVYSLTLHDEPENPDVRIAAVSISPDSTAVAIAKSTGPVLFYVINEEDNCLKFAHTFDPRCFARAAPITDLIFLDDLTSDRQDVPFWKFCVAVSNGGRRLALFECREWKCLGRIRFESPHSVNDFVPILDPTATFVHFLDVDGMNVYSVEISIPTEADELARFVGVTQTSFCHPIYAMSHITKNTFENTDDSIDDIFNNDEEEDDDDEDDDDELVEGDIVKRNKKRVKAKRYFVAMGKKSMVELQLTLKQFVRSKNGTQKSESDNYSIKQNTASEALSAPTGLLVAIENKNSQLSDQLSLDILTKLNDISERLERLEKERKETSDKLCELISSVDVQMRQRESYLLNRIEQMCESDRLDTLAALRTGLTSVNVGIESAFRNANMEISEYVSQRVGSSVRTGIQECVVPAFERTCDELFNQINEKFQSGLDEYLQNVNHRLQRIALAAVESAIQQSSQGSPSAQLAKDRENLEHLMQTSPEQAFEAALNKGDSKLVEFVCSKVNPESMFTPRTRLSQPVLVSLLQQLAITLDHERDLKFRYIELILPAIDVNDPNVSQFAPNVAAQLLSALQTIVNATTDQQTKRYTKLLFQLTRSTFYQSPHPQRGSFLGDHLTTSQNSPM